jgi:hypothetical protein
LLSSRTQAWTFSHNPDEYFSGESSSTNPGWAADWPEKGNR